MNQREWKGLDRATSDIAFIPELASILSIFAECTTEIPLATCTGNQQASPPLKLPQKLGQDPSHTLDPLLDK